MISNNFRVVNYTQSVDFAQTDSVTVTSSSDLENRLPGEMLDHIFSYLSEQDLRSMACTNSSLKDRIINSATSHARKSVNTFILKLVEVFKRSAVLSNQLALVKGAYDEFHTIKTEKYKSISALKLSIETTKTELVDVLRTLDTATLLELQSQIQPLKWMENIFERVDSERQQLLSIETKIAALRNPHSENFYFSSLKIIDKLIHLRGLERAIEFALALPAEDITKTDLIEYIFQKNGILGLRCTDKQLIGVLHEVIKNPEINECIRRDCLYFFSNYVIGQISKLTDEYTIELIETIKSLFGTEQKDWLFSSFFRAFVLIGRVDHADTILAEISSEDRDSLLEDISIELAKVNRFDDALFYTSKISKEDSKNYALGHISYILAEKNNAEAAIRFAMAISRPHYRDLQLDSAARIFAKAGNFEAAVNCVMLTFTEEQERQANFWLMASSFRDAENIDSAIKTTIAIADDTIREIMLSVIFGANNPAHVRNLNRATKIAKTVCDVKIRESTLGLIALYLTAAKNLQKASKVALLISDQASRKAVLKKMETIKSSLSI